MSGAAKMEVAHVSFAYPDGPPVLTDVDLQVMTGTVCALVGANGAGKSTLARLCAGILAPSSGTVTVDGSSVVSLAPGERIRRVRVSFQYPEHELFRRSLALELEWEANCLGADKQTVAERVERMLRACGFTPGLETHPFDLDPWARKLFVSVAALAVPGRLVVLDEPTIRLSQITRSRLGAVLREYAGEGGTVLTVTHDYEFCLEVCDTVALIADGRLRRSGSVDEVLLGRDRQRESNIFAFSSYYLRRALVQLQEGSRSSS